jgi:hypothetical protein
MTIRWADYTLGSSLLGLFAVLRIRDINPRPITSRPALATFFIVSFFAGDNFTGPGMLSLIVAVPNAHVVELSAMKAARKRFGEPDGNNRSFSKDQTYH